MNNHELPPLGDRKGMDTTTPHGMSQTRFDEMVEIATKYRIHVQFNAFRESCEPSLPTPTQEITIFDAPKIVPASNTNADYKDTVRGGHKNKTVRHGKTHDTTGLNGFYKGTYYLDGVAQRPKNKGRK